MFRIDGRQSIRLRLMILAVLTIGAALVVTGLSLIVAFERHIVQRVGQELDARWVELTGAIRLEADGSLVVDPEPGDPRYQQPLSGAYWQITEKGEPLARSRSLWDEVLVLKEVGPDEPAFEIAGFTGGEFYVVARPVLIGEEPASRTLVLAVALDHAEVEALAESFSLDLTLTLGGLALVLVLGAFAQTSLGLAPLGALRRSVDAVRRGVANRLGAGFAAEVQPLAEDLDRLLDHQDMQVARARDRAGALAHGFKTPLTVISLEAERLEAAGSLDIAAVLRQQVQTMRSHVDRELVRARVRGASEAAGALGRMALADPAAIADRLLDVVRRLPYAERVTFRLSAGSGVDARIDPADLAEVLGNLLENAGKFATSDVEVVILRQGDRVSIAVHDDGPGFGVGADGGRNADGSGLGLAIVEDVLGAYGSSLARGRDAGSTVMRFDLPAADTGRQGEPAG